VDGTIAGFITLRQNSPTEGEGVLNALHPNFAGAGIYGQLITRSKQWCQDNGMKTNGNLYQDRQSQGPARLGQSWVSRLQIL
jgi:hypothetical protein